ncbi:polysaccharide deacetylase family protein [Allobranchiibius sp. CTAmp26]|uniref:polysaccharide deacetylase family protein n=1 Tax=Allobranchiibius sp. CTAmp26 TaxID=2815214 RepID=UPI001AA188A1|nr:polysaccharide deacetylase family protein [Allobranchiibius sp. CTAmp26]MBO1755867.1 polysaccharide deacetylase family protein [Allobranchiibius sp. CTAmp26]
MAIGTALSLSALVAVNSSPAGAATRPPTVVSLTFDDSNADQMAAEQTLKANGLPATFYTVDGWIGAQGYLTRANLSTISADGNEIAGHTVTHPDLIDINPAEAQRQICDDRATLDSWGYKPVDFAYPFADANPTVEAMAKNCGYNTARGLGDVVSPGDCAGCQYAEQTPPADPYYLKVPDQVDSTWTLAQMKSEVTNAVSHGGGWLVLTFHHICAPITAAGTLPCPADQSTTPTIFNAFASWLASYAKTVANNTSVATVDQEVRKYLGSAYPAYVTPQAVPNPAPAPVGVNALSNPSLETTDPNTGFPTCFQPGGWGSNSAAWSASTPGHTGTAAEQLTLSNYSSGDAKLLPTLDLGTCSPSVVPGKTYNLSTWYTSTGTTQFALYYRDSTGAWYYWTSSPWFNTASTWTQATFTTPPVPANAVAMTFGLALISNGTLNTDDYSLVDPGTAAAAKSATAVPGLSNPTSFLDPASVFGAGLVAANRTVAKAPHSHLRPLLPGGRTVKSGHRIAVPELGPVGRG